MFAVRSRWWLLLCYLTVAVTFGASDGKSRKKSDIGVEVNSSMNMKDAKHGIKMGEAFVGCDDAKTNLDIDWNGSPLNYTCYHPKRPLRINKNMRTLEECTQLSHDYTPQHFCMDKEIKYNTTIPTYGDHRPLWPVFGEYKFVPPQRWLHNIEHGAVVMLYHPCAHPAMVNRLRGIVMGCLRKYVITRNSQLPRERPLALVAWGCLLQMNYVDPKKVISFIERKALKGPEADYPKEGQYTKLLLRVAKPPIGSDYNDSVLCPFM